MKLLSIVILISVIAAGCRDSNTTTTSTSGGDGVTGDLFGTVNLVDYRNRPISDKSGVMVKCEGTSFSAITDTGGNWTIRNLPTRSYKISFSKNGFYTAIDPIYSFTAGVPVRYIGSRWTTFNTTVTIGQSPRYSIILDGLIMPKLNFDSIKGNVTTPGALYLHTSDDTPDSVYVGILFIAGSNPTISIEDPSSYSFNMWDGKWSYATRDSGINFAFNLNYKSPPISQIPAGQLMYVRAFPMLTNAGQFDPLTNKETYIGYGEGSNILSAVKE
jgi:hypothetical protein